MGPSSSRARRLGLKGGVVPLPPSCAFRRIRPPAWTSAPQRCGAPRWASARRPPGVPASPGGTRGTGDAGGGGTGPEGRRRRPSALRPVRGVKSSGARSSSKIISVTSGPGARSTTARSASIATSLGPEKCHHRVSSPEGSAQSSAARRPAITASPLCSTRRAAPNSSRPQVNSRPGQFPHLDVSLPRLVDTLPRGSRAHHRGPSCTTTIALPSGGSCSLLIRVGPAHHSFQRRRSSPPRRGSSHTGASACKAMPGPLRGGSTAKQGSLHKLDRMRAGSRGWCPAPRSVNENAATSAIAPEVSEVSVRQSEVSQVAHAILEPSVEVVRQRAEGGGEVTAEDGTMHERHPRCAE